MSTGVSLYMGVHSVNVYHYLGNDIMGAGSEGKCCS